MDSFAASIITFSKWKNKPLSNLFSEQGWCQDQLTKKLLKSRHKICRPLIRALLRSLNVQCHNLFLTFHRVWDVEITVSCLFFFFNVVISIFLDQTLTVTMSSSRGMPSSYAQIRGWTLNLLTDLCFSWTGSTPRYSVTRKPTGSLQIIYGKD